MKTNIRTISLFAGSILFTALFYHQKIGLNALIFSIFLLTTTAVIFSENLKFKNVQIIFVAILTTSVAIFIHASALVIFTWILSLFLLQGILHYPQFRTLFYSGISGLINYILSIKILSENINKQKKSFKILKRIFKIIGFVVIPLIFFWIFYIIYKIAVPEFDRISNNILDTVGNFLNSLFKNFSFDIILLLFWGFITLSWFYFSRKKNILLEEEQKFNDNIFRKKGKDFFNFGNAKGLKPLLKYENIIAVILILAVNLLLLLVNIIDISTIWFNFEYTNDLNLKQFVHEGTYLLIFSILLSMAIMLYYFRKNLNFYRKNNFLKITAYVWIFQNLILLISVVIRNLHYIKHFALAYLRIGLFFFLFMVVIGLITLFIKIQKAKSFFYLFRINTWALYIAFVIFSLPDWDTIIAKYNLSHYPDAFVEASYMLTLDEKTYPLLDQHKELLQQPDSLNTYRYYFTDYDTVFYDNVDDFMKNFNPKKILSLNLADKKAYEYFKDKNN